MKITLTLDVCDGDQEALKDLDEHSLKYLLCDAFGEFRSARHNSGQSTESYVEKRYSWMNSAQKAKKVQQVAQRVVWAEALRNGTAGGNILIEGSEKH